MNAGAHSQVADNIAEVDLFLADSDQRGCHRQMNGIVGSRGLKARSRKLVIDDPLHDPTGKCSLWRSLGGYSSLISETDEDISFDSTNSGFLLPHQYPTLSLGA